MTFNAAFRRWFGDSKVVDAEGRPLVVYHGSIGGEGAIDDFDSDRAAFFSPSREIAREYAHGCASSIGAYYLRLENPLVADGPRDVLRELTRELRQTHRRAEKSWEVLQDVHLPELYQDDEVVEDLISRGYDGLIVNDDQTEAFGRHSSFAVFQPEQIKAIDNAGTWSPDDPDIRRNPGSANFEARKAEGWVIGPARYADEEPHHVRSEGGAWIYETMHDWRREKLLTKILGGRSRTTTQAVVEWHPKRGYALLRTVGGSVESVPIPERIVIDFSADVESRDGSVVNYSATIGREL